MKIITEELQAALDYIKELEAERDRLREALLELQEKLDKLQFTLSLYEAFDGLGSGRKYRIDKMVDRFLLWPLPPTMTCDLCVTDANYKYQRYGTNLMDATTAREMIIYMLRAEPPEDK